MYVIREQNVRDDLSLLEKAWAEHETFILLPEKSGIPSDWFERALDRIPSRFQQDHFALLTSGSTGRPKLLFGCRRRAERLVDLIHEVQRNESAASTILLLPVSYCFAFVNQWVWAHRHHRQLVQTFGLGQPDLVRRSFESARDAMICLVGSQVPLFLHHFSDCSFPGVVRVHFAGGRFPQEKLDVIAKLFPEAMVFNNYGCAEAMPRLTIRPAQDADLASDIGRPLQGIELKTNENEELLFRSPYGAVGVVGDGGFAEITPESWVSTGDRAERTPAGSWRILGRIGDVFKRHGEKISFTTLQATIGQKWSGQLAFYRETDSSGEDGHVLALCPQPTAEEVREILKALRKGHPRAHWPLRIESVAEMPSLPNGKIDSESIASITHRPVHWRQRT